MRQSILPVIGSMVGTVLVSTIAIATLIVLQHGSMRSDMRDQHATLRSEMNNAHATMRNEMNNAHAAIRSEMRDQLATMRSYMSDEHAALRTDIQGIRVDVGDMRERVARIEAHIGIAVESP